MGAGVGDDNARDDESDVRAESHCGKSSAQAATLTDTMLSLAPGFDKYRHQGMTKRGAVTEGGRSEIEKEEHTKQGAEQYHDNSQQTLLPAPLCARVADNHAHGLGAD